jgi:hypothetical protein
MMASIIGHLMQLPLKFISMSLLFFALAVSILAQTINTAKLKINGVVGLDSTYAQMVQAFGKPSHETKAQHEECTGGNEKTVKYAGLEFYFMDGTTMKGKTFRVMSFSVTAQKYTVSGVKLGDTEAVVKTKFGKRFSAQKDAAKGETYLIYQISDRDGPGQTTVTLKNGKVTGISSSYTVC